MQAIDRPKKVSRAESSARKTSAESFVTPAKVIAELETLYGGGGGLKGSNRIIETLQERFPTRYEQIEVDFRRLSGVNVGVLTPISPEKST